MVAAPDCVTDTVKAHSVRQVGQFSWLKYGANIIRDMAQRQTKPLRDILARI
jgi:hypothetical protein